MTGEVNWSRAGHASARSTIASVSSRAQAAGAAFSVTVVPADHFEWQPPHMMPLTVSWSPAFTERIRDPESSIGAKPAPQTPQRCSSSDRVRFREMVRLGTSASLRRGA